ncbi:N-acetyltransferase family protein [Vagococcus silagei]
MSLSSFKDRAAYDITAEISIYIDQAFHKQGLGQKTLTFVEEQLSSLDIGVSKVGCIVLII